MAFTSEKPVCPNSVKLGTQTYVFMTIRQKKLPPIECVDVHGVSAERKQHCHRFNSKSGHHPDRKTFHSSPGRFYFRLSGEAGRGMIFYTWSGAYQQRQEGRGWLHLQENPTKYYSHSRFTSLGLYRNWMCECLWKRRQTESLMLAYMVVQDSSEPTFANVVFEIFTQLSVRHQSE